MTIGEQFPIVLSRAKAGDRDALADLYRDTAPLVIGYLRGNHVQDAEDIAGEVFVSVVSTIASFSGDERHFRSWLLTITHRRVVDDIRRRTRRPEEPTSDEEIASQLAPSASLEAEAIDHLRAQRIVDAMDTLSDAQRSAIMLRVLADLSIAETARVMGKRESAVKALLRRATANLERRLAEVDDQDDEETDLRVTSGGTDGEDGRRPVPAALRTQPVLPHGIASARHDRTQRSARAQANDGGRRG